MTITFFYDDGSKRIIHPTITDPKHEHKFLNETVHELRHDFQARTFKIDFDRKPKRKQENP